MSNLVSEVWQTFTYISAMQRSTVLSWDVYMFQRFRLPHCVYVSST